MLKGAFGSLALKIANTVLSLLLAVVLARVLGVGNYGIYVFCLSIVQILSIPAMLGGQQLLVREAAAYKTKGEYHLLRGLLIRFRQASLLASVLLALAAAGIGCWAYQDSPMLLPFLLATTLIPLYTGMQLQAAALRGLRRVLQGQAALTLLPALVMAIVGCIFYLSGQRLGAEAALIAQLISSAILVAMTAVLLQIQLPRGAKEAKPEFETAKWARSALPLLFAGGMQILNRETSVLVLGILQAPEEVGLFRVAQRGAMLVSFGLLAVNMAIAPVVSEMFAKGQKQLLQRMINKSILGILAFALPVGLGLILGGRWILPFVFGQEYAAAYLPLVILVLGQLVNASLGSVGLILNMAGLERLTAWGVAIAALASLILNLALIPFWGTSGAAIASSASLVIWNVLLFIWLYRKTGILSTIVPARLAGKG